MSNRGRNQQGLRKPRQIEAELLGEQWREGGGARASGEAQAEARAGFERRAMEAASGRTMPEPRRVNHLVETLLAAAGALDDAILEAAAMRLVELGLDGDDYAARIAGLMPVLPDVAVAGLVTDKMKREGLSERAASERVAAELAVPAASMSAAVQQVRRAARRGRTKGTP